jgi:regulator of ribonuclease activity A
MKTADVCDAHSEDARALDPILRSYGGVREFAGCITTVKVHEDNSLVREALSERGDGRVLVVDGGGSLRCALVGDMLASLGQNNGWAGIIVYGCVRDSDALSAIEIGIQALGTNPKKSVKRGEGQRNVSVTFGGVTFCPDEWLCADDDGIVVLATAPEEA